MPASRLAKHGVGPERHDEVHEQDGDATTRYGASLNSRLSARSGTMSSFWRNLPTSASSCSEPCGPASIGPSRLCMKLTILNRKT